MEFYLACSRAMGSNLRAAFVKPQMLFNLLRHTGQRPCWWHHSFQRPGNALATTIGITGSQNLAAGPAHRRHSYLRRLRLATLQASRLLRQHVIYLQQQRRSTNLPILAWYRRAIGTPDPNTNHVTIAATKCPAITMSVAGAGFPGKTAAPLAGDTARILLAGQNALDNPGCTWRQQLALA